VFADRHRWKQRLLSDPIIFDGILKQGGKDEDFQVILDDESNRETREMLNCYLKKFNSIDGESENKYNNIFQFSF
jgi:hypothetical protein